MTEPQIMPQIMIVTGGSRGLGAATARLAAKRGFDVCVNYLGNAEGAEAAVRDVEAAGRRAIAVQADVAREDEVERLFETVDRELGTVTALINNAGMTGPSSRLDAVEAETLKRVLDVNVLAVMLCSRAAVQRMSSKHGGKGGAPHMAAVVGDTVGDPFKDTSGPSLNILIKLMSMVSVVFAGLIVKYAPIIADLLHLE